VKSVAFPNTLVFIISIVFLNFTLLYNLLYRDINLALVIFGMRLELARAVANEGLQLEEEDHRSRAEVFKAYRDKYPADQSVLVDLSRGAGECGAGIRLLSIHLHAPSPHPPPSPPPFFARLQIAKPLC
jgi:hypothetical protein